jgi:hypothetical protein
LELGAASGGAAPFFMDAKTSGEVVEEKAALFSNGTK